MLLGSFPVFHHYCSFSLSSTITIVPRLLFVLLSLLISNAGSLSFSSTIMSSNTNTAIDDINLPLLESLATTANSYASAHGIQVEKKHPGTDDVSKSYFECAPISLLPNAYPKTAFIRAQNVMVSFNKLVNAIAHDYTFLQATLGGQVSESDPFTRQLLDLYLQIYVHADTCSNYAKHAHCLGIFRSDYMLHSFLDSDNGETVVDIKQVELNTIAASFAGLSTRVADLHRYLSARFLQQNDNDDSDSVELQNFLLKNKQAIYKNSTTSSSTSTTNEDSLPPDGVPLNPALERLAYAMHLATKRYQECYYNSSHDDDSANKNKKKKLAVLFVVQEGESNTVDQRLLEFQLFQQHGIPVLRRSLTHLYDCAMVDDATTGALTVDGYEIALVYYRAGYAPTDYPSGNNNNGKEWQARARMETSRATKCPSLGYHLAGTKKVQQALARPGVLERFVTNPSECAAMRRVFAGLYSTSQKDNDGMMPADYQAIYDVVVNKNSHLYVLKPQREGGGYNFYGDQLAEKLNNNVQFIINDNGEKKMILNDALGEYILMQRLFPPEQDAILLRSGRVEGIGKCISELGCFGTILCGPTSSLSSSSSSSSSSGDYSNQDVTILHNEYAGFLLRTKFSHVDEGGVASGFATLSSPYLC